MKTFLRLVLARYHIFCGLQHWSGNQFSKCADVLNVASIEMDSIGRKVPPSAALKLLFASALAGKAEMGARAVPQAIDALTRVKDVRERDRDYLLLLIEVACQALGFDPPINVERSYKTDYAGVSQKVTRKYPITLLDSLIRLGNRDIRL